MCETELIVAAAPTRGQAVYDVEEGVERWDESQRHAADAACALEAARQVQQQIVGQLLAMTDHFEALILQLEMAVSVHCPLPRPASHTPSLYPASPHSRPVGSVRGRPPLAAHGVACNRCSSVLTRVHRNGQAMQE